MCGSSVKVMMIMKEMMMASNVSNGVMWKKVMAWNVNNGQCEKWRKYINVIMMKMILMKIMA